MKNRERPKQKIINIKISILIIKTINEDRNKKKQKKKTTFYVNDYNQ